MNNRVFPQFLTTLLLVSSIHANTLYFQPETDLICPDNKHSCKNDTTCCLLPDGQYGCCMYANAVCCSDNIHCCPKGSYCDVNNGSCNKDGVKTKWSKKVPAVVYIPKEKVKNQQPWVEKIPPINTMNMEFQQPNSIPWAKKLPGLKINSLNMSSLHTVASCSEFQTLCKSDTGLSGCCPFPNAVCCNKGQFCCPSGFQCNLKSSRCEKPTEETSKEMTSLLPGHKLFALTEPVMCPDGVTTCPKDSTCCLVGKASYACCPYPKATCCSDLQHCCPNGYSCDVTGSQCVKKKVDMILVKMTKWQTGHFCPDMKTICDDQNTCCPLRGGKYGCCPYPLAVCCSDNYHCCPRGYTCDVKASKCQIISQDFLTCPDHQTQCSSGMTCCQREEHVYGCCPFPKATCCSDNQHCCPQGYKCDLTHKRCLSMSSSSDIQLPVKEQILCPDRRSICPSFHTCCKLQDGSYGCCPYPKAKCCSDMKHCCPANFICDPIRGRCRIETPTKEISFTGVSVANITFSCPDSLCPLGATCCPISSSHFGCCPLPKAVCCKDNKHCCPRNYQCDLEQSRCVMGQTSLPLVKKFQPSTSLTALKIPQKKIKYVLCPDYSECPDRNTCCLMNTGAWGCCPFFNAVCCTDRQHCCPNKYFCNMKLSKCIPSKNSVNPFVSMVYSHIKYPQKIISGAK